MALQLLNWLLSEAVKVFYNSPFEPGLCQSSHLGGEQRYWCARLPHIILPQNSATVKHRPATTGVTFLHFSSSTPTLLWPFTSVPYLSELWMSQDRKKKQLLLCELSARESCTSYLWDFVSGTMQLRSSMIKRLVPLYSVLLISTTARARHLWKKKKFFNNLRKLQKTLFTMQRQSCTEGISFVCLSL